MPRARRAALLGGGVSAYVDLNFAAAKFKAGTSSAGDLTALPGFTFTRASLAMGYDATGKLVYGPNNLCLQSGALQTTPWGTTNATVTANATAAPDGTVTAAKVVPTNATTGGRTDQSITLVAGTTYRISIYAKAAEWGWLRLRSNIDAAANVYFNLNTGVVGTVETGWSNATITSVGNGWYRCSASYVPGSTGFSLRPLPNNADNAFSTGDGTSGIYLWGAQLEAVTYQTTPSTYYPTTTAAYYGPRLVYDPVTLASLGILVEEARTNLCLQSSTFGTTWAATNATVSSNSVTSPDGTANADTLIEAVGAGQHYVAQTIAGLTNPSARTLSVYAKYAGRKYLALYQSAGVSAWFDLQAGTVSNVTGSAVITDVGSGWYRCSITIASSALTSDTYEIHTASTAGSYSYTGDGTSGIYLYQAQLEQAVGASSPIPTTTASVTRAADVPNLPFNMPVTSTWAVDFQCAFLNGARQQLCGITDSGNSRFMIRGPDAGAAPVMQVGNGASTLAISGGVVVAANTATKLAARVDSLSTNAAVVMKGGSVNTGAIQLASATTGAQTMRIGCNETGIVQLNGTISRIRIYNRALSDAQLQSLTS